MGVLAAACGKWYILLLVIVAFFILAFVALYLHADYHFLSTYGKTDKVSETVPILD